MSYKDQCRLCSEKFRKGRAIVLNNSEELFDMAQDMHKALHGHPLVGIVIACHRCRIRLSKRLLQISTTTTSLQRYSCVESMDVELKCDKETQTSQVIFSDVDVQCTLIQENMVSLPFRLPSTSHQYCAICQRPFGRKSYTALPDNI